MADIKDLAEFFRGGEFARWFTMFQNQVNQNYNYYSHDMLGQRFKAGKPDKDSVFRTSQKFLSGYMLMALIFTIVSKGRLPKDLKELGKQLFSYAVNTIPFFGNIISSYLEGFTGQPPPMQIAEDIKWAVTGKKPITKIKAGIRAGAKLAGIPYSQPNRTIQGIIALVQGESDDIRRLIYSAYTLGEAERKGKGFAATKVWAAEPSTTKSKSGAAALAVWSK